ncbi:MAG: hypothetical protein ABIE68_04805 [bacterium]
METDDLKPRKPIDVNKGFKKIILVLGLIVILNLFIGYGVSTFYDSPNFEDYCPRELSAKNLTNEESCEEEGGLWSNFDSAREKEDIGADGYCDETYTCSVDYDTERDLYNRNAFVIHVIAGMIAILIGFFMIKTGPVSIGFSFGGLLSLVIGTMRYWSAMDDYLRFTILGLTLALLIWIGIKKFKE